MAGVKKKWAINDRLAAQRRAAMRALLMGFQALLAHCSGL
jgi:hypothetical protein